MKIVPLLFLDKLYIKILTFCFFVCAIGAQGQDYFTGTMVDAITDEPLPYVNIGVLNMGLGTVSNEDGKFILKISKEKHWSETIQFSSIGYTTVTMPVQDLIFDENAFLNIELQPKVEVLEGIVLTSKGQLKPYPEIVGFDTSVKGSYGYWNKDIALGGELATKIPVRKGPRKLRRLSFTVVEKASDSVLVRVNVYNQAAGFPKENLVKDNIILTLNTVGVNNVDLTPYDIEVTNDFILSLELLQVYGDKIDLVLLASERTGESYKRYASQDKWESIYGSAMAYVLDTDYYSLPKGRYKKREGRKNRTVSGYIFKRGRGVANVAILNETTKERVLTDAKGKYMIEAETNDMLRFIVSEKNKQRRRVDKEQTINLSL